MIYPHAIVYDFEACLGKTECYKPTADLTYENKHVAISVSVGHNMNSQPTHICNADTKALIVSFMDELKRRANVLRTDVKNKYMQSDIELLSKKQQQTTRDLCAQVLVLGFSSGKI